MMTCYLNMTKRKIFECHSHLDELNEIHYVHFLFRMPAEGRKSRYFAKQKNTKRFTLCKQA